MNISKIVELNAARTPHWDSVISEDQKYSWEEFNSRINRLGNAMRRLGIEKGDRVCIYLPNSPEYLITYFAIVRIGAVAVPFNIMYKSSEISYILNDSEAKILFASAKEAQENVSSILSQSPNLKHLIVVGKETQSDALSFSSLLAEEDDTLETVDCAPDDPVTIMYTSGTTGLPKGAMLTHNNFWAQADLNGCYVLHINDQDRILTAAPFCHIFFVTTVLGPMFKGAAVITMPRFFPDKTLDMISRFRATHYCGVPTMYIYMLEEYKKNKEKYNLGDWRFAQSAGSAMPAEYISQIEENFGVGYCECYGATETSAACSYERLGHRKAGSIGLPAHTWQIRIVDDEGQDVPEGYVGEIVLKGPGLLKGYWKNQEATEGAFSHGWYHTGDLARADEEGYLYIVDRKKDLIISGGYNIYPREIEELLFTHPAVLEAAVVGISDSYKGEIPKAYIVLKQEMTANADDIITFCKERLAAYKVPRDIEFCKELSKGSTGKILKNELKAQ
jgi:long-chain acyl-CoA synthetase